MTTSVRTEAKAQQILALHPSWKSQLSFVYIADIVIEGVFDDVFLKANQPFDYIIHTASPVNFAVTDFQTELIDPAVQGYSLEALLPDQALLTSEKIRRTTQERA